MFTIIVLINIKTTMLRRKKMCQTLKKRGEKKLVRHALCAIPYINKKNEEKICFRESPRIPLAELFVPLANVF